MLRKMSSNAFIKLILQNRSSSQLNAIVRTFHNSLDNFYSAADATVRRNDSLNGLNFAVNQDTQELVDLTERFTKEEIIPKAAYHDATGEYPWEIVKKAHSTGLMNLHVPQQYGGLGLGTLEACLMVEKLAYGCTGITQAIDANNLAYMPIALAGNHEQKKKYLSWLMEEPIVCSYGVTEPGAGSDVAGIKTKAVKKGRSYCILNLTDLYFYHNMSHIYYFINLYLV